MQVEVVDVFGVATARAIRSCIVHDDNKHIDVPVGVCVARWNVDLKQRLFLKQLHQDAITNIIPVRLIKSASSFSHVLVTTYGGDCALWDFMYHSCLWSLRAPNSIMHAAVSLDHGMYTLFGLSNESFRIIDPLCPDPSTCVLSLWRFNGTRLRRKIPLPDSDPRCFIGLDTPTHCFSRSNMLDVSVAFTARGDLIATSHIFAFLSDASAAFTKAPIKELLESRVELIDATGKTITLRQLSRTPVICIPIEEIIVSEDGLRVLVTQARRLSVFDESLALISQFSAPKRGAVYSAYFKRSQCDNTVVDTLFIPSTEGLLHLYPQSSGSDFPPAEVLSVIHGVECPSFLTIVESKDQRSCLWVVDMHSVFRLTFKHDDLQILLSNGLTPYTLSQQIGLSHGKDLDELCNEHDLACCGLDFSSDGCSIAVGDLAGNVCVWTKGPLLAQASPSSSLVRRMRFEDGSMVRSLTWQHDLSHPSVLVGMMDGNVWQWFESGAPKLLLTLRSAVTCMQFSHGLEPRYLALSDIEGYLTLLHRVESSEFTSWVTLSAHTQMDHVASHEVWSIAFSPDNSLIATAGEDHSTHIYSIHSSASSDDEKLKLLCSLGGKTMAVTSLDWRTTVFGDLLIASSDDRTIHVWTRKNDSDRFEEVTLLTCDYENLMITYCALEPFGSRIAAVTMGGHLYVWNLTQIPNTSKLSATLEVSSKVQVGSIEGLRWSKESHLLATVSSDCTATLLRLKPKAQ